MSNNILKSAMLEALKAQLPTDYRALLDVILSLSDVEMAGKGSKLVTYTDRTEHEREQTYLQLVGPTGRVEIETRVSAEFAVTLVQEGFAIQRAAQNAKLDV